MVKSYASEDAAVARVETLKQHGIWTGYYMLPDGRWALVYDPVISSSHEAVDSMPPQALH